VLQLSILLHNLASVTILSVLSLGGGHCCFCSVQTCWAAVWVCLLYVQGASYIACVSSRTQLKPVCSLQAGVEVVLEHFLKCCCELAVLAQLPKPNDIHCDWLARLAHLAVEHVSLH